MTKDEVTRRAERLGEILTRPDLTKAELDACYAELRAIDDYLRKRARERRELGRKA